MAISYQRKLGDGTIVIDSNTSNVGIGTNDPLRKLHVVGDFAVNANTGEYYGVLIQGGESATPKITIGDWHNSSATIKWDSSANHLVIDSQHATSTSSIVFTGNDSATEYMRIDASGNVGIGTTSPEEKLHVVGDMTVNNGNNFTTINIESEKQTGNLGGIDWRYRYSTNDFVTARILADANGNWKIFSGGGDGVAPTTAVTVNTSQNVGIGTTSPSTKLHVAGDITLEDSGTPIFKIYDSGNGGGGGAAGIIQFSNNDGDAIGIGYTGSVTTTSDLIISTNAGSTYGGYLGLDAAAIADPSSIILDPKTSVIINGDVVIGEHRIIDLPSFNMGASSVTDEYLVVCKQAPSGGGVDASGIQGRISFSRGSSGSFNNSQYIDINIQMSLDSGSVNNLDVTQFELYRDSSNPFFSQLEEIDIDGTKYVALKARSSGGGETNHFYFEGSISDASDTNILSRVRASDSTVTVTDPQPSGFPIAPYITKNQDGDIGIGTTSPSANLEVAGAVKVTDSASGVTIGGVGHASLRLNRASTSYDNNILFNTNGDTKFRIWQDGNADYLYIRDDDNATNMVTFKKGGNVGIGTTSPSTKLDVDGFARFAKHYREGGFSALGATVDDWYTIADFSLNSATYTYENFKGTVNWGYGGSTSWYAVEFDVYFRGNNSLAADAAYVRWSYRQTGNAEGKGGSAIRIVRSDDVTYEIQISPITNYGVVNWEVLSPKYSSAVTLTTYDTVQTASTALSSSNIVQDSNFYVNGNVGIGTTNPSSKLEVRKSTATHQLVSLNRPDSDVAAMYLGNDSSSPANGVIASNYSDLILGRDQSGTLTEHVRIKRDGNVGIGTTSPSTKLHIYEDAETPTLLTLHNYQADIAPGDGNFIEFMMTDGNATATPQVKIGMVIGTQGGADDGIATEGDGNFVIQTTNATGSTGTETPVERMRVNHNGNVGIGTSDPTYKLDVYGSARIGGSNGDVDLVIEADADNSGENDNPRLILKQDGGLVNGIIGLNGDANNSFTGAIANSMYINSTGIFHIVNDGTLHSTFNSNKTLDLAGKNYVYGHSNYHISLGEDSGAGYIGNVNGSPYISNSSYYGSQIYNVTSTQTGIASVYTQSTGDILLLTSTFTAGAATEQQANTRMIIKGNGNVGIGTTNPGYNLEVSGDTFTSGAFIADGGQLLSMYQSSWNTGNENHYVLYNAWTSGTGDYLLAKSSGNQNGNNGAILIGDGSGGRTFFGRHGNQSGAINSSTDPLDETYAYIGASGTYFRSDVGIGTNSPGGKLHITGDFESNKAIVIEGTYGTDTTHYIRTHGVNSEELAFYSGTAKPLAIDTSGRIRVNNAFYLPTADGSSGQVMTTNGSGTLSWSNVTSSDTLDDVTDNGNSTTNSIILGDSTTNGTMLVRGSYASGNIVVIGGMKSSGGAMIGYAVKPDTATNHGFVSSSAYTLERAAYYQQGNRHRWYAGASQNAAIGNAVTMSETMRLDFDKLGLSTSSPASLIHLGKPTNGANIITFGEASIGGPHGLDFYGDDATRTKKYSIYYRTGTENISMETSDGTKRFEINQSGAVTLNEAFTFPTADGSAGAALVTNGSGSLSWNAGYQQYTPVGWGILNNQTYTSTGSNISSNSTQAQAGTTPVQRNSATEFEATKAGWYEISYSFIVKNNYANRAMVGAYMTASSSGGGGVIPGSHSTQYVRYSTYGEYAQIQNTFYYYTSYSSTNFYLFAYLLSGSMNMTTQAVSQSMISFRYINNDIA